MFHRTKHGATKLHRQLERDGYKVGLLHGGKSQSQRSKTLATFTGGRINILIATNVAARAGKDGVAVTLVGEAENKDFNKIKRALKVEVRENHLPNAAWTETHDQGVGVRGTGVYR